MDQNNIIILRIFISSDHLVVKFFQQHIIFQSAVTEFQQELLRSSRHFRIDWKFHINHIFTDRTRKCLLKNIKIFKCLFFRQGKKGFFRFHLFIFLMIHIAATNSRDRTVLRRKLLTDLQYFFFIHRSFSFIFHSVFLFYT